MFEERVARAKELLKIVRHAALATVNPDGSPHNSPVFVAWDKNLDFYWASGQETQHSKNLARDGRVFAVIFDSVGQGGGLYVQARAAVVNQAELEPALKIVNPRRVVLGRKAVEPAAYKAESPQRLYRATCEKAWVNVTERNATGDIVREHRAEVRASDLF